MKFHTSIWSLCFVVSASAYAECPPLDPAVLWLPEDKAFAKERFVAMAKRLNDAGQCVVEGGFGSSYQKFYITVSPNGDPTTGAKILRYSYEELAN